MKKVLCTALLLSTAVGMAEAHNHSQEARIASLEAAIAELKQQNEQEKAQAAKAGKSVHIPGTSQSFEIIFRPTLNVIGDCGQVGKDSFSLDSIPLDGVDAQSRGKGGFSMTPAGTRLGFKTKHDTANAPIESRVEVDFNARTTSRLQPRLRHAYLTYGRFLAGQTDTVFYDSATTGDTVDMSGIMGHSLRQAQLRVTHKVGAFDSAFSLERPFTDVAYKATNATSSTYSSTGTAVGLETPTSTEGVTTRGSQFSQPSLPDAAMSVKYNMAWGYVGVRGIVRDLRVKNLSGTAATGTTYNARKTGYGAGAFVNIKICEKARLFGQFNVGRGLGRYLPDIGGYSAYVDPTLKVFDLIRVRHYLAGFEYKWTSSIRSNVVYHDYHLTLSKHMPNSIAGWSKDLKQAVVNTFVKPLPNTEVGVEYMYAERKAEATTVNNLNGASPKGKAHRIQMVVMYTF